MSNNEKCCEEANPFVKLPDGGYECVSCGKVSYKEKDSKINKIIALAKDKAENVKMNAAYNGEFGDGGAHVLLQQIQYYEYGRKGVIPPEWERLYGHLLDDEWKEYERLKRKFGGK